MSGLSNNSFLKGKATMLARGNTKKKYSMYCRGIPFVGKTPTYPITGEVWDVADSSALRAIDGLEGHPTFYKREPIEVLGEDGETYTAQLYFCEGPSTTVIRPNGDYREYLNEVRKNTVTSPVARPSS